MIKFNGTMEIRHFIYTDIELSMHCTFGVCLKLVPHSGYWDNTASGIDAFMFIGNNSIPYFFDTSTPLGIGVFTYKSTLNITTGVI